MILAHSIGMVARNLLEAEGAASVMGLTSRGLFLSLPAGRVVFLSTEPYRGPLTLNLSGDLQRLEGVANASPVRIASGEISFPQAGFSIRTDLAQVWAAPPRPAQVHPPSQRLAVLEAVIRTVAAPDRAAGFAPLLPFISGARPWPNSGSDPGVASLLQELQRALRSLHPLTIAGALQPLLGWGKGLTPSGDDLVLGLLLALRRWGDVLSPGLDLAALARSVVPQAYRKTAALSAGLIDCAALGQADERLVSALDGLMTGAPGPDACAALLAAWGASSGFDALAGMALLC